MGFCRHEGKSVHMKKETLFHVKKHILLAVAGCVWLIAGFNVARMGVLSYRAIPSVSMVHILLSAVVFCAFGLMFYKMSMKHTRRIMGYAEKRNSASCIGTCAGCIHCCILYRTWLCTGTCRRAVLDYVLSSQNGCG